MPSSRFRVARSQKLISRMLLEHRRVIFDGNGYSDAWKEEAVRRGLSNLPSTAVSLPTMIQEKNIDLVVRHGIFTENEFRARYAIYLEAYNKIINIEARTMVDMALHQILPAALHYSRSLCDTVSSKKGIGISCRAETGLVQELAEHTDAFYDAINTLKFDMQSVPQNAEEAASYYHDVVIPAMEILRKEADILESMTDKSFWPYPTYSDLLFY